MPPVDPIRPPTQLEEEAALWCQRMRGPDAGSYHEEYEKWLKLGAYHRQAYQQMCRIYEDAERLKSVPLPRRTDLWKSPPIPRRWSRPIFYVPAVAAALIVGAMAVRIDQRVLGKHLDAPNTAARPREGEFALEFRTKVGEIRTFRLTDGSKVTLDTDSLLRTAFNGSTRELALARGRARFDVAHENRPFVVDAGGGTVTAHGTLFDVDVSSGRGVRVRLLRGAIDVRLPSTVTPGRVVPLAVGQSIAFQTEQAEPSPQPPASSPEWPSGLAAYDGAPLSAVIGEVNRYSALKIVLADPKLGLLPVHGTLKISDARVAAAGLAGELGLDLTIAPDRIILSGK